MVVSPDPYDYLDAPAARLKMQYPHCKKFILNLLAKYKTDLREKTVYHGESSFDVIDDFLNEVREHCHRKKALAPKKPRKSGEKHSSK